MGTTGFWAYYWAVLRRIGSDIKKHVLATMLVLFGGIIVALLQERYKIITPAQTWIRPVINVIPSTIYLGITALFLMVRAPWKLHVEHEEKSIEAADRAVKKLDDLTTLLLAAQA